MGARPGDTPITATTSNRQSELRPVYRARLAPQLATLKRDGAATMGTNIRDALKALDNPTRLAILGWLKDPRRNFPEQEVDPEEVGVPVSAIKERTGLSQSTVSHYLIALQRAQLVTSKRIGSWTYYKRNEENISSYLASLESLI